MAQFDRMKTLTFRSKKPLPMLACGLLIGCLSAAGEPDPIPNRFVDYDTFLKNAAVVGELRQQRRVTEAEFARMAGDPGTVLLDARSKDKYDKLHIQGAKHLSFPEITAPELAKVIPTKATRVLIYCNNNFLNAPNTFATKAPSASLNIHTFNTLYSYGYTNVYELGPLIDVKSTILRFEGTQTQNP